MTIKSEDIILKGLWYCINCNTIVYNKSGKEFDTFPPTHLANCRVCCKYLENTEFEKV